MIFKLPADSIIVRSKDSSHKGNTIAAIPGAFAEVKFDAHDSTFMMFYSACENPGCSCTDVVVTFSGKRSQSKPEDPRIVPMLHSCQYLPKPGTIENIS